MTTFVLRSILFTLFLALPSVALAICDNVGDGRVYCLGPVKTIYSNGDGALLFEIEGSGGPQLACSSPGSSPAGWWDLPRNHPLFREWHAMLLTASATGQTMNVISYVADAGQQCRIQRLELRSN